MTGGRGIVARNARVKYRVDRLRGSKEVVGGWRSSNSSSLMGDGGSAVVAGAGKARKGDEEKREGREAEADMEGLFDTIERISGGVGVVGTCQRCCRLHHIYVVSWVRGAVRDFRMVKRSIPSVQIGLGALGIHLWKSSICFCTFFRWPCSSQVLSETG